MKNPFRSTTESPDIATYKALRAASKTWFDKVMQHPASKRFNIVKAARSAGIEVAGNLIVFDEEFESAVLMDHYLFDYRPEEKSVAESCVFAPGELTPLEAELHQAHLASRTSLFLVTHVHPDEPKILLQDRLLPNTPELWLTDLSLADSCRRIGGRVLLFTRVVSLRGLNITGGFSFVFDPKQELALIEGYRRELGTAPKTQADRRRTRHFLRLNSQFGLDQAYPEAVPPDSPA